MLHAQEAKLFGSQAQLKYKTRTREILLSFKLCAVSLEAPWQHAGKLLENMQVGYMEIGKTPVNNILFVYK